MSESYTPEQVQKMKLANEAFKAGASPEEIVATSQSAREQARSTFDAERLKKATEIFKQAVAEGHPNPVERVAEVLGWREPGMVEDEETHAELLRLAELVAKKETEKAA